MSIVTNSLLMIILAVVRVRFCITEWQLKKTGDHDKLNFAASGLLLPLIGPLILDVPALPKKFLQFNAVWLEVVQLSLGLLRSRIKFHLNL